MTRAGFNGVRNDARDYRMTTGTAASLTLTDGSRFVLTRDRDRLRIRGVIATPGAVKMTVDSREVALPGTTIDRTEIVPAAAPIAVVLTEQLPTGDRSTSSVVLQLSEGGTVAASVVTTARTGTSTSGGSVAGSRSSSRSVVVTRTG
jgi:hypothetical protein